MQEEITADSTYSIPLRYRKMENLHIVFWILKDIAWCTGLKIPGLIMVAPTLTIAIVITWRTRTMVSELCHNLAIAVWIIANSYWMTSEFFHFDEHIVTGTIRFKHLALIPFGVGVCSLAYYYLYWQPRHKEMPETI